MDNQVETGCCPRFDPEPWDEKEITWEEISGTEPPVPGEHWGLNIWQHRQQSEQALTSWRGAGGGYQPGRFGVLVFD